MRPYKFIISGGGTGGHIFPALAIAHGLRERFPDSKILFVGAQGKMEMERVPKEGFEIIGLWISGIQRTSSWRNLLLPFKLLSSLFKTQRILRSFKPDVVIGTGGYASGPMLYQATRFKIPTLIQEQNSYAGKTNKWLAKKVDTICVAYDNMERYFPREKLQFTGNPIRSNLLGNNIDPKAAIGHFGLEEGKRTLLVLGGSLGARRINRLIEKELKFFEVLGIQLLWQCGKFYYDEYSKYTGHGVRVEPFIDRMDMAYTAADFIISRAGALAISELCLVGKPILLVPSPNLAEDHQTKNATALAEKGAALVIKESELDSKFEKVFEPLFRSKLRQRNLGMQLHALAKPNATEAIVEQITLLLS